MSWGPAPVLAAHAKCLCLIPKLWPETPGTDCTPAPSHQYPARLVTKIITTRPFLSAFCHFSSPSRVCRSHFPLQTQLLEVNECREPSAVPEGWSLDLGYKTAKAGNVPCPGAVLQWSWKPVPAKSFPTAVLLFVNTKLRCCSRGLHPGAMGAVWGEAPAGLQPAPL